MVNKIDKSAVLEMWADPAQITTRKIAAHFGIANGTVCWIIIRARDKGDVRAARRNHKWMMDNGRYNQTDARAN